ncbi:hypothetical protein [Nonomuraea jiangxiensis]|uniref:Uncharacterized protein n=1 Tax=Nonomuraea jiangxiensis TaxID=633440 RepID=A0A1G9VIW1_9ACTN|nr:hypothetical protein [Nonomuraea jiangxiensis]SDM72023.1 hypothetical protein SAMN05421869_15339 [Nonomuraea jiangxiensis]
MRELGRAVQLLTARYATGQLLTARYATGQAALDWRRCLRTLPLEEALRAALADSDPGPQITLAVVVVAAEHHRIATAALDSLLAEAVRRARKADTSWDLLGQAVGMTRQGAAQLSGRLRQRTT